MAGYTHNSKSQLEETRKNNGDSACINLFTHTASRSRQAAARLLNSATLTYPCLYLLMPQIKQANLYRNLAFRSQAAIRITETISDGGLRHNFIGGLSGRPGEIPKTLRWIIETSSKELHQDSTMKEVVDICASVLICRYEDHSILPLVDEILLQRHKNNDNIHDLTWAFFQSKDPRAIALTAKHLQANNEAEYAFARHILNTEQLLPDGMDNRADCCSWLEENLPYLYITDDNMQQTSKPCICKLDLDRKYLNRPCTGHKAEPLSSVSDEEAQCLQNFHTCCRADRHTLSEWSHKCRKRSRSEWDAQIKQPIAEQLKMAKAETEDFE